ncbi:hypothetical protein [Enterococcus ureilyticus]|uniref:hypothetical protein n=1 Tax=Enterococcus ureilyticus TaxID=1131292 RepID=UPI001428AB17|nr:hypothetical protein [Enterococcus ureilyticus]
MTGYARADDEQYLATKGSEVTLLGITKCYDPKHQEVISDAMNHCDWLCQSR